MSARSIVKTGGAGLDPRQSNSAARLKCGQLQPNTKPPPLACPRCGAVYAKLEALAADGKLIRPAVVLSEHDREAARAAAAERQSQEAAFQRTAYAQRLQAARTTGNWAGFGADVIAEEARRVALVTTDTLPGAQIVRACGIVVGDFAYAYGALFEEFGGLMRNLAGSGQSPLTTKKLQEGREHCLSQLRLKALDVGANAVLGVRFDYEEFSGANNKGVTVVSASGTAVWSVWDCAPEASA